MQIMSSGKRQQTVFPGGRTVTLPDEDLVSVPRDILNDLLKQKASLKKEIKRLYKTRESTITSIRACSS